MDLDAFAAEVGSEGAVTICGSSTRGGPVAGVRVVTAPSGIIRVEPEEMIVECGAGTPVAEVEDALGRHGQRVCLPSGGTVGGALAVGTSGIRRLGDGPTRDALLQARYVSASGDIVTAGGQTVKNVSGFDLCRLLVGSRGTLGFLGSVILRTQPLPAESRWYRASIDPVAALTGLYRPTSLLWNGETVWALLEGHPDDIADQVGGLQMVPAEAPELPTGGRWSVPPAELTMTTAAPGGGTGGHASIPEWRRGGRFIAELGVGVIHHERPAPAPPVPPEVRRLNERVLARFDPTGRLNPGLDLFSAD